MIEPKTIYLPVRRVTAFEDRAEVRRWTEIALSPNGSTVRAEALPALIDPSHLTVQLEVEGERPRRVEGVTVSRRWTTPAQRSQQSNTAKPKAAQAAARTDLQRAKVTFERAKQRREAALKLLGRYIDTVAGAAWSPNLGDAPWETALPPLETAVDTATLALAKARAEKEIAAAAYISASALVSDVETDTPDDARRICDLEIQLPPGEGTARLVVAAVMPCALWRPAHEAHLHNGEVVWRTFATVWQRTGEPWTGVELVLSTDRPGAGATLPRLNADTLYMHKKQERRLVLTHRDAAISTDQGQDAVPGVYDGGEARWFKVEGPVDIPSDGRPHRVHTGGFKSAATTTLVAVPELDLHVFLKAALHNRSAQPLLAGPVTLLRDGGHVGTGDLKYVGPGEPFDLSFGSDDNFLLNYERRREIHSRLVGRDRTHFVQRAEVKYGGADQVTLRLVLRTPTSELAQVKVKSSEAHTSEGAPTPDTDGLMAFELTLGAGGRDEVECGFYFETSGEVSLPDPW